MFCHLSPQFIHKSVLKKSMLEELRDYPRVISQMLLGGMGTGIISGTDISWDQEHITVGPGLLAHGQNIFRMEEEYRLPCMFADRLMYLKIRFIDHTGAREVCGSMGEIYCNEQPPEREEIELGRFRLQEGARLRTQYENVEDYQTEYDTVNRIHMPWLCPGGTSIWPKLLLDYAKELLGSGSREVTDVSFAMQILGSHGQVSGGLLHWYIEHALEKKLSQPDNKETYQMLLQILKARKKGQRTVDGNQRKKQQILLI